MRALVLLSACLASAALLQAQAVKKTTLPGSPTAPKAALPAVPQGSPAIPFKLQRSPELPGGELRRSPVLIRRDDGRIVLAWESLNPAKKALGEAALYDDQLRLVAGPVATTNPRVEFFGTVHDAVAFANGNVLVASNEYRDNRVSLGLFDAQMKPLKSLFPLSSSPVTHLALARLSGGNTVAALYFDGQMRMAILSEQGEFVVPPKSVIGDVRSDRLEGLPPPPCPMG
jgi:hypothetical protein